MKIFKKVLGLISPKQENEDKRRKELILNIVLAASIICFSALNIVRLVDFMSNPYDSGLPLIYTLAILAGLIFLFWLSRRGKIRIASWLTIAAYASPMAYAFISWGADLPAALLMAVLVIALCGSLISTGAALISAAAINAGLISLTALQASGRWPYQNFWRQESHQIPDAISYAFIFMVIAFVSWLFCKEIERALRRARSSEAALKIERDQLEIRVEERTRQIKQMETEKINQLYRLAEFGRLSSGIFHDLINPLTAISLNLEQVNKSTDPFVTEAKSSLAQAVTATRKMEGLVASIKKQIQKESRQELFSLNEEIKQALQILGYKARQAGIELCFQAETEISSYGDPVKFSQIVSNLIANAIDSYKDCLSQEKRVEIRLEKYNLNAHLAVKDWGCGIAPADQERIFQPFFSTKKAGGQGLGLGLSSSRHLLEKSFQGELSVKSEPGKTTEFLVKLPIKYEA